MKFALLRKEFKAWNEVQSILKLSELDCDFVAKSPSIVKEYFDPLGYSYPTLPIKSFNTAEDVLIVPGDVHRQTHPLSYGKIPYKDFHYKLATTHTSGWSPWDYLGMVDLAKISRDDPINAAGCRLLLIMNKKFYEYFMKVDWTSTRIPHYEKYKAIIDSLIEDKYIYLDIHEPSQYWLSKIPKKCEERIDEVGVALNWANFKTGANVERVVDKLVSHYSIFRKPINIKMHSFLKPTFLKYFEGYDFIHIYSFEEMNKYEFTDKYLTYIVDGTGLGYEVAFRSQDNPEVNIYYMDGLDARNNEFLGLEELGALPVVSISELVRNPELRSNYTEEVLRLTYPYTCDPDEIPNEIGKMFEKYGEIIKNIE